VITLASRAEGIRALSDPGFDLSRRAFLVGDEVEVERCAGADSVEWRSRRPAGLALDVGMACRGMVIVAGVWYPGWKAAIDGKDAVIHEAYGFLRGVVVPAGKHRLEMRYRPWTVAAGGALSGIGFLAALVLGLWGGRKLRAAPA
jgi:hypothetical protein